MALSVGTRTRRALWHPAFLVPAGLVAVAAALGSSHLLVLLLALVCLTTARVVVGAPFDAKVQALAVQAGKLLTAAIFGLIYVVAFIPAWALSRPRWQRDVTAPPAWLHREPSPWGNERHPGTAEPSTGARNGHPVLVALGLTLALLLADQAIGALWNRVSPPKSAEGPPPTLINVSGSDAPPDPRAADPAMGGVPWANQYFDELNNVPAKFWPFIGIVNGTYSGEYVNGAGWTRASYEPPKGSIRGPLISFYGGSTMFGIGQRDGHTIPSEVARLAASEGYPIQVRNHGMSGFVSWQEMLLFEHLTDQGERPLRAVFYDGTNDVYAQRQPDTLGSPTNTEADQLADALESAPSSAETAEPTDGESGWWDVYRRDSAIARATTAVRDALDVPAGATPTVDDPTPQEQGQAAAEVYVRGRSLIESIAGRADIEPLFFWQPVPSWDDPATAYSHATAALSGPTVPIVDCLDEHPEVYLSDAHTNEMGARLVAKCMWDELEPAVAQWYEEEGVPRQERRPDVLTDLAEPLAHADLGLTATDLGPGWSGAIAVPNVVADCAAQLAGPEARIRTGPSYGRSDQTGQARLTTAVIELTDAAQVERLRSDLRGPAGTRCITEAATLRLGIEGDIDPMPLSSDQDPANVDAWVAGVRYSSLERDGQLAGAAVARTAQLVIIQGTGSVTGWAPDAVQRASLALAS